MATNQMYYFELLKDAEKLKDVSVEFLSDMARNYPLHQPLQALLIKRILIENKAKYASLRTKANLKVPFKEYIYQQFDKLQNLPSLPPLPENVFTEENENESIVFIDNQAEVVVVDAILEKPENQPLESDVEFGLVENIENTDLLEEEDLGFVDGLETDVLSQEKREEQIVKDTLQTDKEIDNFVSIEEDVLEENEVEEIEDKSILEEVEQSAEKAALDAIEPEETIADDSTEKEEENEEQEQDVFKGNAFLKPQNDTGFPPNNRLERLAELSFVMRPKKDYKSVDSQKEQHKDTESNSVKAKKNKPKKTNKDTDDIGIQELDELIKNDLAKQKAINLPKKVISYTITDVDDELKNEVEQELLSLKNKPNNMLNNEEEQAIDKAVLAEIEAELTGVKNDVNTFNRKISSTDVALNRFDKLMKQVNQKDLKKTGVGKNKQHEVEKRINNAEIFENTLSTETMARFLEQKGKIEQSIQVFESLKLKFPKKSSYFANQIDRLKKKLL